MSEKLTVIDGVQYREVKRKARLGELIKITDNRFPSNYDIGEVFTVEKSEGSTQSKLAGIYTRELAWRRGVNAPGFVEDGKYVVLEPIGYESVVGCKAVVTNNRKTYTSYREFAIKHGYPDAVYDTLEKRPRLLNGEEVTILAQGPHEWDCYGMLYIVENADGNRFIINSSGVSVKNPPANVNRMIADIATLTAQVRDLGQRVVKLEAALIAEGKPVPPSKAPKKLTREDVITKAKADVEKLVRIGESEFEGDLPTESPLYDKFYDVEFVVNRDKRTAVALVRGGISGEILSRGKARCAPNDCFNASIGRAIALRRALGLEVPAEYLNAPQPTEPQVGDIVEWRSAFRGWVPTTLTERRPSHDSAERGRAFLHSDMGGWLGEKQFRIIDDSREGGGAE